MINEDILFEAVRLALWFSGILAAAECLFFTLWQFLWLSLTAAGRALGPWQTGADDGRIARIGSGEPAYRAYWSLQMWTDAGSAAGRGLLAIRDQLAHEWLGRITKRLFQGRRPSGMPGANGFTRFVMRVIATGIGAGAIAGALLAAVLVVAVLVVFGLLLSAVWLLAVATALSVRAGERVWALARGIRMKCPHPDCYRPIRPAVHHCPNCRVPHRALRPDRYGALWRVCVCGEKLAAASLAGRGRLTTHCPHCDQELPEALGTTRVVHLPFVGGTSSGKTMLMAAVVAGLWSWSRRSGLRVDYASRTDQQEAGAIDQQLKQTGWAHATTGGQPRAFMLRIGYGRRSRLLYLYDPMGESLRDARTVREQQYLAHSDGVVLVVDVLAEPQVRRALGGGDAELVTGARPSPQAPMATYQRLTGELAALTGRRRRIPVATVVTKRDVLDQLGSLPVPGARVDSWLESIGLGGLVRGLGHDFDEARYWAVSAHAATGAGALDGEQRRAAEPVLWLLARSGLRIGSLATGVGVPRTERALGERLRMRDGAGR